MAEKTVSKVSAAQLSDAIDIIARAELRSASGPIATEPLGQTPRGDAVPAQNHLAPQGLANTVDAAMGPIQLPRLIDLHSAILRVRDNLASAVTLPEDLSSTAISVLDEETLKIDRYLALHKR